MIEGVEPGSTAWFRCRKSIGKRALIGDPGSDESIELGPSVAAEMFGFGRGEHPFDVQYIENDRLFAACQKARVMSVPHIHPPELGGESAEEDCEIRHRDVERHPLDHETARREMGATESIEIGGEEQRVPRAPRPRLGVRNDRVVAIRGPPQVVDAIILDDADLRIGEHVAVLFGERVAPSITAREISTQSTASTLAWRTISPSRIPVPKPIVSTRRGSSQFSHRFIDPTQIRRLDEEREVRERLLLSIDAGPALPDPGAVDRHPALARVVRALHHLHRRRDVLLVVEDAIPRLFAIGPEGTRRERDEEPRREPDHEEERSGARHRAYPTGGGNPPLPARALRDPHPPRPPRPCGARQVQHREHDDPPLYAEHRQDQEARAEGAEHVSKRVRRIEPPEVPSDVRQLPYPDLSRERQRHPDERRRDEHDEEAPPEAGEEMHGPASLEARVPRKGGRAQVVKEWHGGQRGGGDPELNPPERAPWIGVRAHEAKGRETPERDPDEERGQHGDEGVRCGPEHLHEEPGPEDLEGQGDESRERHHHQEAAIPAHARCGPQPPPRRAPARRRPWRRPPAREEDRRDPDCKVQGHRDPERGAESQNADQDEARGQAPGHRAERIEPIEEAQLVAELADPIDERAGERRQRPAHEERRGHHHDRGEEEAHGDEPRRIRGQPVRRRPMDRVEHAEERHPRHRGEPDRDLEPAVEAERIGPPIGHPPEEEAAEREPTEKGGEHRRHRMRGDAEDLVEVAATTRPDR